MNQIESSNALKEKFGHYRWFICALIFFATTINYVDRAVLGVLAPTLRTEIGWTDQQYGYISAAFTLAYAIGFLFAGWFIDKVGTRIGYALYLTVWSFAAAAHALVTTAFGFGLARFALGIGESGNFSAAKQENPYLFVNRAYLDEKRIIITTNFSIENLKSIDPRITDRLKEVAHFLLFEGNSFRS